MPTTEYRKEHGRVIFSTDYVYRRRLYNLQARYKLCFKCKTSFFHPYWTTFQPNPICNSLAFLCEQEPIPEPLRIPLVHVAYIYNITGRFRKKSFPYWTPTYHKNKYLDYVIQEFNNK